MNEFLWYTKKYFFYPMESDMPMRHDFFFFTWTYILHPPWKGAAFQNRYKATLLNILIKLPNMIWYWWLSKTAVTPSLIQWSYCSLALSNRYCIQNSNDKDGRSEFEYTYDTPYIPLTGELRSMSTVYFGGEQPFHTSTLQYTIIQSCNPYPSHLQA